MGRPLRTVGGELWPANCLSLRFIEEVFFAADDFAVLHVDAGDTARDVAHDFVVDGATDCGDFFDGDEAVALTAEEDDFVTGVDVGFAADVDHALVHADSTDLGDAVAMVEDVDLPRQDARITIGIADGQGRDFPARRSLIMAAIADGRTGVDEFDMGDAAAQGHDGP